MKPPIPTPEPVPVQTLRRYGLNSTADEVAEVYRQHGELLKLTIGLVELLPLEQYELAAYVHATFEPNAKAILTTATQKKG